MVPTALQLAGGVRGAADPIPAQLDSGITFSFQCGKHLLHELLFFIIFYPFFFFLICA